MRNSLVAATFTVAVATVADVAFAQSQRIYIDDYEITHRTSGKPTIVTFAHTAVSLFDYGLTTDQLVGTYGEYVIENSDIDIESPEQASSYTGDPEPEDLAKLSTVRNLSPECARKPGFCTHFNVTTLLELDPDYLIVHGYGESPWGFRDFTEVTSRFPREKIIFNDISLEGEACSNHTNCFGKSMIDIIEQYRELSVFLGFDEPSSLEEDLKDLCAAAQVFTGQMELAHMNGVRAMAANLGRTTLYFASPNSDMVLRMFEELGMPLFHVGACSNCTQTYFWEWVSIDKYFHACQDKVQESCNNETMYPVDIWIYDHRVRASVWSDEFAVTFPDKALLAKQYAEWPLGGRKVTPRHAVEILQSVGPAVASSTRVHPQTDCIPDLDVTSNIFRRSGADPSRGAGAGQYACFHRKYHNQKYFQTCRPLPTLTPLAPPKVGDDAHHKAAESDANTRCRGTTALGLVLWIWGAIGL